MMFQHLVLHGFREGGESTKIVMTVPLNVGDAEARRHGQVLQQGHRAVMLYLVQRTDCQRFQLAADIDPAYAAAFVEAQTAGVERLIYTTNISPQKITLGSTIPAA